MTHKTTVRPRVLSTKLLGAVVICIVFALSGHAIVRLVWFQSLIAVGDFDMSVTLSGGRGLLIVSVPLAATGRESSGLWAYTSVTTSRPEDRPGEDWKWYSVELTRLDHGKGEPIEVRANIGIGLLLFACGVIVVSLWCFRTLRRNRSRGCCIRCGYPSLNPPVAGQEQPPSLDLHRGAVKKRWTSTWGWRAARTTAIAIVWILVEVGVFGLGSAQLDMRFAGPPESASAPVLAFLISESEIRIVWSEDPGHGRSVYFAIEAFVPNFRHRQFSSEYREEPVFRAPSIAVSLAVAILMRALLSSPVWRCGLRIGQWARSRPMESSGATAARCPECGFRASAELRQSKH